MGRFCPVAIGRCKGTEHTVVGDLIASGYYFSVSPLRGFTTRLKNRRETSSGLIEDFVRVADILESITDTQKYSDTTNDARQWRPHAGDVFIAWLRARQFVLRGPLCLVFTPWRSTRA